MHFYFYRFPDGNCLSAILIHIDTMSLIYWLNGAHIQSFTYVVILGSLFFYLLPSNLCLHPIPSTFPAPAPFTATGFPKSS